MLYIDIGLCYKCRGRSISESPTTAEVDKTVFFCDWYCFNHPANQLKARFTIDLTYHHHSAQTTSQWPSTTSICQITILTITQHLQESVFVWNQFYMPQQSETFQLYSHIDSRFHLLMIRWQMALAHKHLMHLTSFANMNSTTAINANSMKMCSNLWWERFILVQSVWVSHSPVVAQLQYVLQ